MVRLLRAYITVMLSGCLVACNAFDLEGLGSSGVDGVKEPLFQTAQPPDDGDEFKSSDEGEEDTIVIGVENKNENPGVSLLIWHGLVDNEILAFRDIILNFQHQNPDIQIDLKYIPYDDLYNHYLDGVYSGHGPSILIGAGEWGLELYENDLISDLSRFEIAGFSTELIPSATDAVTYQGAILGIPITASGMVMYRNGSIISETPKSVDQLILAAQIDIPGESVGTYLERGGLYALPQLSACGGRLMLPNGFPAFNNQSGKCWIELLQSYEEAGPVSFNGDDDLKRFKDGKVGIIFDGTWNMVSLSENLGDDLNIDRWPQYEEGPLSGYLWTENIYFNSSLDQADLNAAVLFSEYLISPESQTILAGIGLVPVRMNLMDVSDLMTQASIALSNNSPYPPDPVLNIYIQVFNDILKDVYEYRISSQDAVQKAAEQITNSSEDFKTMEDDF